MTRPERWRRLIATGFGLGRAPVAPGTVGSLAALPLAAALWQSGGTPAMLAGVAATIAVGLWSAGAAAAQLGDPDPGPVVIDEIAGQLVSLLFIPTSPGSLAIAFLLFRTFDIWKPPPARRLERLSGASGIMADDLAAGIYANALHQLLRWALPAGWVGA